MIFDSYVFTYSRDEENNFLGTRASASFPLHSPRSAHPRSARYYDGQKEWSRMSQDHQFRTNHDLTPRRESTEFREELLKTAKSHKWFN